MLPLKVQQRFRPTAEKDCSQGVGCVQENRKVECSVKKKKQEQQYQQNKQLQQNNNNNNHNNNNTN